MPDTTDLDIDASIALRLLALRQSQSLSLAQLAERSGVSKAMISRIERAESSATAALLGRLAAALGVPLAQLLAEPSASAQPLRRRQDQEVWRDPEVGYLRRQVAPAEPPGGIELVEVEMPRRACVSYPRWSQGAYRQRLWMLEGELAVTYGEETFHLAPGDCLSFSVDRPLTYRAQGRGGCRYLLVVARAAR
ncbi:helix-turn-helix domain-containing protein [Ramlibacter tataouinensis]|uniref:Transcriptional regulator, XRE family-like protein n=1 Tax=Ramlibacter tataouinensis (strain ATCC BAA-407 / DSM 14655 / LMG 21543 / TTB310) TaxID=365046 RepID=F5Y3P8_RAMTT|nr:helix-turn-helix domain-containing protein [Ramlibacter tataouinensis]AEG93705.1 transcriptional regulator, XRE family-like protein [Ramlibacter tataouinensis TTB310]